jgi:hypothetical protein
VAKRPSPRTIESLEAAGRAVAPPVFDPSGLYTDAELAAKAKMHVKTWRRARAKDPSAILVKFSKRTHRTTGDEANRMLQARLKNSAA